METTSLLVAFLTYSKPYFNDWAGGRGLYWECITRGERNDKWEYFRYRKSEMHAHQSDLVSPHKRWEKEEKRLSFLTPGLVPGLSVRFSTSWKRCKSQIIPAWKIYTNRLPKPSQGQASQTDGSMIKLFTITFVWNGRLVSSSVADPIKAQVNTQTWLSLKRDSYFLTPSIRPLKGPDVILPRL